MPKGLVALLCGDTAWTLAFVDPTSGGLNGQYLFPLPEGAKPSFDPCTDPKINDFAIRADFSADFTKLAVNVTDASDGTHHVGIIDGAGSNGYTDLTPSSGSFTSAPNAHNIVFQTGSSTVVYYETGSGTALTKYDLGDSKGQSAGTVASTDGTFLVTASGKPLPLCDEAGCSVTDDTYTPDGTLHFNAYDGSPNRYTTYRSGRATTVSQDDAGFPGGSAPFCEPAAWLTTTTVLCQDLSVATLSNGDHTVRIHSLVPATDRTNLNPVVSSDGRAIAFESDQGSTRSFFEVNASGGTPQQIPIPTDGAFAGITPRLIAWNP